MIKFFRKSVPKTNEMKNVDALVTYQVRWHSRNGKYEQYPEMVSANPEVEVFLDEKLALDFKESLEHAFSILKYTGCGITVTIEKVES